MSGKKHVPVIDRLVAGWKHPEGANMAFNDALAEWHSDKVFVGRCHEYMGLTWPEYKRWVEDSRAAAEIVEERIKMKALSGA